MQIKITDIKINPNRRTLNIDKVKELSESIKDIGLLNPITLNQDNQLIAGLHRIEAYKLLNRDFIECNIINVDTLNGKLAEIDENLMRNDLHFIERGECLKQRKIIYEELYPETKRESSLKQHRNEIISFREEPAFTDSTAKSFNVSKRTIEQEIQMATNLIPDAKKIIIQKDVSKTDAILIARQSIEKQKKIIKKLAQNKTAKEAIKNVNLQEKRQEQQEKILQDKDKPLPSDIILLEGDIFDKINEIKNNSIDLFITDPPYGVKKDCEWDKQNNDFLNNWVKAVIPKLKKEFIGFIFCDSRMLYEFETVIKQHFTIKNRLIWIRKNLSMGRVIKDKFISSYEVIFYFGTKELNLPDEWGEERFDSFEYAVPQTNFKDCKYHPTQKPLELFKRLIKLGSQEKNLVLDCFAGSGTTGVACKELNRNCVLIEREQEYIDIIKGRLYGME